MMAGAVAPVQSRDHDVFHFVLIHGAFHGAWARYRLEDALQKAGCKVSSMDMTGAGVHPANPDSVATWEDYHQPVLDFFASLPERDAAAAPHDEKVRRDIDTLLQAFELAEETV